MTDKAKASEDEAKAPPQKFTVAGRLLEEMRLVDDVLATAPSGTVLFQNLEAAFTTENSSLHWTKELGLFAALIDRVEAEGRRVAPSKWESRYDLAFTELRQILSPANFGSDVRGLRSKALSEAVYARIEALDDLLENAGAAETFDRQMAELASREIEQLLASLENESGEVIDFVRRSLSELQAALNRFALYGGEGIADAVAGLAGGIALRYGALNCLPSPLVEKLKQVQSIVSKSLACVVYAHGGYEALTWAGDKLQLMAPSVS